MIGRYVTTIAGKLAVVDVYEAMDGGMVEFKNPLTDEVVGCAGINWWRETKHAVSYDGPLPSLPDEGRWL